MKILNDIGMQLELIFFKFNCIELKYIELDSNSTKCNSNSIGFILNCIELSSNSIEKKRNANWFLKQNSLFLSFVTMVEKQIW
jgi:hypothetical protein